MSICCLLHNCNKDPRRFIVICIFISFSHVSNDEFVICCQLLTMDPSKFYSKRPRIQIRSIPDGSDDSELSDDGDPEPINMHIMRSKKLLLATLGKIVLVRISYKVVFSIRKQSLLYR